METNFGSGSLVKIGREFCCKGAMKSSQSGPCRIFSVKLFEIIFEHFLCTNNRDYENLGRLLDEAFREFVESADGNFKHKFMLKKDLKDYPKPTRVQKLLKTIGKPYLAGSDVEYAHYPFVFDEGPFYGPIGNDVKRRKYSLSVANRQCTACPSDLIEIKYKELFEELGIHVSRARSLELDLKAVLDKIFNCLEVSNLVETGSRLLLYFKAAYQKALNSEYFTSKELSSLSRRKHKSDQLSREEDDAALFNSAVAKKMKTISVAPKKRRPAKVKTNTLEKYIVKPV